MYNSELLRKFTAGPWNHRGDGKFHPQFSVPQIYFKKAGTSDDSREDEGSEGITEQPAGTVQEYPTPPTVVQDEMEPQPAPPSPTDSYTLPASS